MTKPQIIVSIGAEGGSIDLFGYKDATQGWRFCRGVNDQTPTILPQGEYGGAPIKHSSQWVNRWEEALALLDRYPWAMLSGLRVHPIFHQRIWTAVNQRLEKQPSSRVAHTRDRWANLCGMKTDPHE